jgi:colicin import membrane protein
MRILLKTVLIPLLLASFASFTHAAVDLDELLSKIDADISASRLSTPANNNAIDKIWHFKNLAPFDQRINNRANRVGASYVSLANRSTSAREFKKAQGYLDNAWMLSYLTPGLDAAQTALDKIYKGGSNVAKATTKKAPAKKVAKKVVKQVAKVDVKKQNADKAAKRKKELAAATLAKKKADQKLAKKKAKQQVAKQRRVAEEKERKLVLQENEQQAKRQAASKLAELNVQRERAANAQLVAANSKIASFDIQQDLLDNHSSSDIRTTLVPICQEILDNQASVVLHTMSKADYRWLTVRLTLCVRRLDKGYRLRHSYQQATNDQPSISLHPGRSVSLLKQSRY